MSDMGDRSNNTIDSQTSKLDALLEELQSNINGLEEHLSPVMMDDITLKESSEIGMNTEGSANVNPNSPLYQRIDAIIRRVTRNSARVDAINGRVQL